MLLSLLGCIGGITIPVVFLITKPPAVELLSGPLLVLVGLAVPILVFGTALPRLNSLLFPAEAPNPLLSKDTTKIELAVASDSRGSATDTSSATNKSE